MCWSAGYLLYCSHHSVVVYSLAQRRVLETLSGHADAVRCLAVCSGGEDGVLQEGGSSTLDDGSCRLLSGSADATLRVWARRSGGSALSAAEPQFRCLAVLRGHSAALEAVDVCLLPLQPRPLYVAVSAAQDGCLRLWSGAQAQQGEEEEWCCLQLLPAACLPLCLALTALNSGLLALAVGGVDGRVALFLSSSPQPPFRLLPAASLTGHGDWVRGLSWCRLREDEPTGQPAAESGTPQQPQPQCASSSFLLASASQDRSVRVWSCSWQRRGRAGDEREETSEEREARQLEGREEQRQLSPPSASALDSGQWQCSVALDSLLQGHDDWVTAVSFGSAAGSRPASTGLRRSQAALLSCSADGSVNVWRARSNSGAAAASSVWQIRSRLLSGSSSAFCGAVWGSQQQIITQSSAGTAACTDCRCIAAASH